VSSGLETLKDVADPLTTVSILAAAWLYIWRAGIVPLWQRSPWVERRKIHQLASARTLDEAARILDAPMVLRRSKQDFPGTESEPQLAGYVYSLLRTAIEVFTREDGVIYGYTVRSGRFSRLGEIDVAGLKVTLGRTSLLETWAEFFGDWTGERDRLPSKVAFHYSRGGGVIEATDPWGATRDRSWAVGSASFGDLSGAGKIQVPKWYTRMCAAAPWRRRFDRIYYESSDDYAYERIFKWFGTVLSDLDPRQFHELANVRGKYTVNLVSTAHQGPITYQMVQLHEWDGWPV
jgi:hypothetical protein